MMPAQKPHRSRQDYQTPPEFLAAVTRRFGEIAWDLAAHAQNTVVEDGYFGPGSAITADALGIEWRRSWVKNDGWFWLNPPFADIAPWAEKCAEEMQRGARILLLVPASVGSQWYARSVVPVAHTLFLAPRLTFVGETAPYPKDLMLCVYAHGLTGCSTWQWAPARPRKRSAP